MHQQNANAVASVSFIFELPLLAPLWSGEKEHQSKGRLKRCVSLGTNSCRNRAEPMRCGGVCLCTMLAWGLALIRIPQQPTPPRAAPAMQDAPRRGNTHKKLFQSPTQRLAWLCVALWIIIFPSEFQLVVCAPRSRSNLWPFEREGAHMCYSRRIFAACKKSDTITFYVSLRVMNVIMTHCVL